ncbi:hypothetical protein LCGC14_0954990 [marine sediment metagenome]|uniref:Uncharacterized protein n=1 Tax=marine sediment metagenome TaxID=412755 RepID=A0A0F9RMI7_9ZZZZ
METDVKETGFVVYQHEVKAILEGRQTMFRRVLKKQPPTGFDYKGDDGGNPLLPKDSGHYWMDGYAMWRPRRCPYGQVGDRLWLKETFYTDNYRRSNGLPVLYKADGETRSWNPSIHLPRWASRITLEITGVKVERVQDISEEDAIAEGIKEYDNHTFGLDNPACCMGLTPQIAFMRLWDRINAKRGYGWDVNPWDWALTFRRLNE